MTFFAEGRFAEAVQAWVSAAEGGDANAALYLGAIFDTGLGVAQDYTAALAWYERSANDGNPIGMFNTGVMYDAGWSVPRDPAIAASWYAKAAAKGFGRAEYNLAQMAESGSGVPVDRNRAIRLYRAAASHGVSAAMPHLAQLGDGRHLAETPQPVEDVAMREFRHAQDLLLARSPVAAAQAVELFRLAARDGNPLAQYDLGYCYEHGIGVSPDRTEALRWYRLASKATNGSVQTLANNAARKMLEVSHIR